MGWLWKRNGEVWDRGMGRLSLLEVKMNRFLNTGTSKMTILCSKWWKEAKNKQKMRYRQAQRQYKQMKASFDHETEDKGCWGREWCHQNNNRGRQLWQQLLNRLWRKKIRERGKRKREREVCSELSMTFGVGGELPVTAWFLEHLVTSYNNWALETSAFSSDLVRKCTDSMT